MNIQDLFSKTKRPDSTLFFKSQDPNDIRIGSMVSAELGDYEAAEIVVLSCSQDEGVKRNNGRPGSAKGPEQIRKAFYKLAAPKNPKESKLFDLGDTTTGLSLEEIHENHFQVVTKLLEDGKRVIVLGGGNDLSYPDVKALRSVYQDGPVINIDAHLDVRENEMANSGTPYRQLLDEGFLDPRDLFEIGYQDFANSKTYLEWVAEKKVNLIPFSTINKNSIETVIRSQFGMLPSNPLFLGFDMDSVKAADAPGVSAPSPIGFTSEQALFLVHYFVTRFDTRIFEVTEVNPDFDLDSRTSKLAAVLIHMFLRDCDSRFNR